MSTKGFEAKQQEMVQQQLAVFESELEQVERMEREKTENSIRALTEERERIISGRKQKMLAKLQQVGASDKTVEQQKLIQSYNEDTQRLVNRMDAERLRIEADLKERIRRKMQNRQILKKAEMKEEMLAMKHMMEEKELLERQRLAKEETKRLESLHISVEASVKEAVTGEAVDMGEEGETLYNESVDSKREELDPQFTMQFSTTLSEQQLSTILVSSPLYKKLEQLRLLLQKQQTVEGTKSKISSDYHYTDPRDAEWETDMEFHPTSLDSLSTNASVIYKFGCCIIELLVQHCNHNPVSLLIADRLPANRHLLRNSFRNSFMFDQNNCILYMRRDRLDSVGDFILVLIHTLAHIKVGCFSDDGNSSFIKEFYDALSLCLKELFFSASLTPTSMDTKTPSGTDAQETGTTHELLDPELPHTDLK